MTVDSDKNTTFFTLSRKLQDLLKIMEDADIFAINYRTNRFTLTQKFRTVDLEKRIDLALDVKKLIRESHVSEKDYNFLIAVFRILYFKNLYHRDEFSFEDIDWFYRNEFLLPGEGQKEQKEDHFEDPAETDKKLIRRNLNPRERWDEVARLIEQKKIDMGVWISNVPRDHNFNPTGRLDPQDDLFKKLVSHYNLTFANSSGWDYPVPAAKGLVFILHITKTGFMHMWVNQDKGKISWKSFIKQFFAEFSFLNFTEQSQLLQCFEENQNKVFLLETANTIGPQPLIEAKWKGATVLCKRMIYNGRLEDVKCYIDFSKGKAEIEFFGAPGPCRLLQELITKPYVIAESLLRFEGFLEEFLGFNELTDRKLNDLAQHINQTKTDLQQDHNAIKNEITENRHAIETTGDQMQELVTVQKETTNTMHQRFDTVDVGICDVRQDLMFFEIEHVNAIDRSTQTILDAIELQSDEIKDFISSQLNCIRNDFLKNIELVIYAINKTSKSVNTLHRQTKLSKSSLYRYLKKLQDAGMIETEKIDTRSPGRKSRRFKLKEKIKKMIKEVSD
mgnify:CR=1 FL=1